MSEKAFEEQFSTKFTLGLAILNIAVAFADFDC